MLLVAVTTVLGMIPLLKDPFFVAMAAAIMFRPVSFACDDTMIVVPTPYFTRSSLVFTKTLRLRQSLRKKPSRCAKSRSRKPPPLKSLNHANCDGILSLVGHKAPDEVYLCLAALFDEGSTMTTESTGKILSPGIDRHGVDPWWGPVSFRCPDLWPFNGCTGPFCMVIAGVGMLMLALVFQTLAERKPDLDAGAYAYAKAGFGNYRVFLSALGYWAGSCIGNVSYFVLIKSTLGLFFPVFGDGNTIQAVAISSVILWTLHFLILRGIKQAAVLNTIATVAKLIPILIFLVILAFKFNGEIFRDNLMGGAQTWAACRTGSRHHAGHCIRFPGNRRCERLFAVAKKRSDVGVATVVGFLGVLCIWCWSRCSRTG